MKKALSIVGSSRENGPREENDFYPTPSWATEALMEREVFEGEVWECACGDGAMSEVIEKYNPIYSSDLINRGYGDQMDFLKSHRDTENIITNPPYSLAKDFILKAKIDANKKIAMFLKTVFLEGSGRYEMFQDKKFPLKKVYQFSHRVSLYKNGEKLKNSGMMAFAWFVWEKGYEGRPEIEWIK